MKNNYQTLKVAIIGLGYVGLPLAVAFSKKRSIIGFDINRIRINELKSGIDKNLEVKKKNLLKNKNLTFTFDKTILKSANCFIITVPTPINKLKTPDLRPLLKATKLVAGILKKNDLVIYESTVYPGCIEEICVPVLEKYSQFTFNVDFFCGYSPERINPGDKKHTISNIKKITSGSTTTAANIVNNLYKEIVNAGTYKTSSIKIAEAAKVIENTQRDINIALVNELSILFEKMNLNTNEILNAAKTKWNFLPFKPGLVGGHCIGVDPYYLTYKAKKIGYFPKLILSGRKLNDAMSGVVVTRLISKMKRKNIQINNSKILCMGLTFKENCPDIRNSGVVEVVKKLKKLNCKVDLYDPWADKGDVMKVFKQKKINLSFNKIYDAIIIAVAHENFKNIGINKILNNAKKNCVIFDLKNLFKSSKVDISL